MNTCWIISSTAKWPFPMTSSSKPPTISDYKHILQPAYRYNTGPARSNEIQPLTCGTHMHILWRVFHLTPKLKFSLSHTVNTTACETLNLSYIYTSSASATSPAYLLHWNTSARQFYTTHLLCTHFLHLTYKIQLAYTLFLHRRTA